MLSQLKACYNSAVKTDKNGFTLIEVMFAILVLALLVIGGASMMSLAGRGIVIQGHSRTAAELANALLEREKAMDYKDISVPSSQNSTISLDDKTYNVRIRRTKQGTTIADEAKRITVTVAYYGDDSVTLSYARAFE